MDNWDWELPEVTFVLPMPASKQDGLHKHALYSGSKFTGHQEESDNPNKTEVCLKAVDIQNKILSGYLKTSFERSPSMNVTTFFNGEIISEIFPFRTHNWNVNANIDKIHWYRMKGTSNLGDIFEPSFNYKTLEGLDYIYMRWKEKFYVPEHRNRNPDVSLDGFYYVCLTKSTGAIEGYYYNEDAYFFQPLHLTHVKDPTPQVYEFR